MKRKSYGRDAGLTLRMILTSGLLGLLVVYLGWEALTWPDVAALKTQLCVARLRRRGRE